jgi:hypothetical protein
VHSHEPHHAREGASARDELMPDRDQSRSPNDHALDQSRAVGAITEAICVCEYRTLGIEGIHVRQGQVLPVDDPRVKANPQFFREIGRPMQEVNTNG